MAHVAGRGAHQTAHRVPLLVLAHVEAHHPVLAAEQSLGERPRQLRLADARRTEEQEAADRPVRAGQARAGTQHGVRDDPYGLLLAHHPLVQMLLQAQQAVLLLLGEPADRDARLPGHDLGDRLGVHPQALALVDLVPAPGLRDALLQLLDAVAQLHGLLILLVRDRLVLVAGQLLDLTLHRADVGALGAGPQPHRAPAWSIRSIALSGSLRSLR